MLARHADVREVPVASHATCVASTVQLSWIATGTSPTSSCIARMTLPEKLKTLPLPHSFQHEYINVLDEKLASLRYVPLDFPSINIRVVSYSSFQNLPDKNTQIGFVFSFVYFKKNETYLIFTAVEQHVDQHQQKRLNYLH